MPRLAEQGSVEYAVDNANTTGTVSRLGAAGYIQGMYKEYMAWASTNVGVNPSRLAAKGRLFGAFHSDLSSYASGFVASGDYMSTPDSVNNSITGDISFIIDLALDDWTPTAVNVLVAKDGVSATTRSYSVNIQTNGTVRLNFSTDGTAITSVTSSVPTGFVDGNRYHIAVERESATGKVRFYTGVNHIDLTLLGTEQTAASGNIFNSTTALQFGTLSSTSLELKGKIFDSEIYAGLQVTTPSTSVMKVDFDPVDWVSGTTWTSEETGEVWTINGNAKVTRA
jgi:hypothetical protein